MKLHTRPHRLIAIDEERTRVREDAFDVLLNQAGENPELVVASVVPKYSSFNRENFVNNLRANPLYTQPDSFLDRESRIHAGLHEKIGRNVICVRYKDNGETISSHIELGHAVVSPLSYETFEENETFPRFLAYVESLLMQDEFHTWRIYTAGVKVKTEKDKMTPARKLISGINVLFNAVCSKFCDDHEIPTIKNTVHGLTFERRRIARFSSPLRRATSYINIINLANFIEHGELLFTAEKLRSIGIPI